MIRPRWRWPPCPRRPPRSGRCRKPFLAPPLSESFLFPPPLSLSPHSLWMLDMCIDRGQQAPCPQQRLLSHNFFPKHV